MARNKRKWLLVTEIFPLLRYIIAAKANNSQNVDQKLTNSCF